MVNLSNLNLNTLLDDVLDFIPSVITPSTQRPPTAPAATAATLPPGSGSFLGLGISTGMLLVLLAVGFFAFRK